MDTNGWNWMNKTEVKRDPNGSSGGGECSPAAAGVMLRLSLALTALLLLPAAHLAAQEATNPPANPVGFGNWTALSDSLATHDEQPVADGLMRRLWRDRLAAPKPDEDPQDRAALTELIQKVRSMTFEPKKPGSAAALIREPLMSSPPVGAPETPQPVMEPTTLPVPATPAAPEDAMPTQVMEALQHLLADPNQVSDPAEMAELLFLSGRLREAAVLYRKALEIATRSAPAAKEDRAWVLLQLGNCLRETDATQARAMYTTLAAEYPDSPWAEFAKAQSQFITWSETARPRQWISPPKGQELQGGTPKQASQP